MRILRQILRGCGTLPHVGEHPGTLHLAALLCAGALGGLNEGWAGAASCAAIVALAIGPLYLYGAYDRANLSDDISAQQKEQTK